MPVAPSKIRLACIFDWSPSSMLISKGPASVNDGDFSARTVGELVRERLSRARVFERFGIDYFCGGRESLAESCAARGLNLELVVSELSDLDSDGPESFSDNWSRQTLGQLVKHISSSHNLYLKRELPRLIAVIDDVKKSYAKSHPEVTEIREIFRNLTIELGIHVLNDEKLLFPLCARLSPGGNPIHESTRTEFRSLAGVIQSGSDSASQAFKRMRELTNNFAFRTDVGSSFKFMLQALRGLESDLHLHFHEENNILIPILLAEEFRPAGGEPNLVG